VLTFPTGTNFRQPTGHVQGSTKYLNSCIFDQYALIDSAEIKIFYILINGRSKQKSPDALTESDLITLITTAEIKREASDLMARFPLHLTSVAHFEVQRLSKKLIMSQKGGVNGSSFDISMSIFDLSVVYIFGIYFGVNF
jgi:hypothetical protein